MCQPGHVIGGGKEGKGVLCAAAWSAGLEGLKVEVDGRVTSPAGATSCGGVGIGRNRRRNSTLNANNYTTHSTGMFYSLSRGQLKSVTGIESSSQDLASDNLAIFSINRLAPLLLHPSKTFHIKLIIVQTAIRLQPLPPTTTYPL